MTNQDLPKNRDAVNGYQDQARDFLSKSREYLAANDLHQAADKGWSAAENMTKAVAAAYGWEYRRHRDFSATLNNAYLLTGNARLLDLRGRANDLSDIQYERKRHLDGAIIGKEIEGVAELLDLLEPLLAADATTDGVGE